MKNFIILLFVSALFTSPAFGQKTVPENVKKEFAKKYPAAQDVKWGSEEANEWEAEFTINGTEMSASFDSKALWLESETEISAKDLPATVTGTLTKDFAGYKAGEMSIFEDPKMKGYEIALKKGEAGLEVVIDNSGKVIKKTELKKEKEEKEK
jgi:hypothetical protein